MHMFSVSIRIDVSCVSCSLYIHMYVMYINYIIGVIHETDFICDIRHCSFHVIYAKKG